MTLGSMTKLVWSGRRRAALGGRHVVGGVMMGWRVPQQRVDAARGYGRRRAGAQLERGAAGGLRLRGADGHRRRKEGNVFDGVSEPMRHTAVALYLSVENNTVQ